MQPEAVAPVDASITLEAFVHDFADAFTAVDAGRPVWSSRRTGKPYQAGLGPHEENEAVKLVLQEMRFREPYASTAMSQFKPYPSLPKQKCDVWIGDPLRWAIEVKMARFMGDNNKPADVMFMRLLSPYPQDHSAVTDCVKLAKSGFDAKKAVVIYGFDYADRKLDPVIDAFESLAGERVQLGERVAADFKTPLVHPVHAAGRVFGWEVEQLRP